MNDDEQHAYGSGMPPSFSPVEQPQTEAAEGTANPESTETIPSLDSVADAVAGPQVGHTQDSRSHTAFRTNTHTAAHAAHKANSPSAASDGNGTAQYLYAHPREDYNKRATGPLWQALGIVAEILFTAAAICALYIVWQMWWTGVQSQRIQTDQRESASWSNPTAGKNQRIAAPQSGTPPVEPTNAKPEELIAQIYIPRFGNQWQRNIVEGTDMTALNEHGIGHYTESQMPGQIGNFAAAGHRNGYGQPLGDVDKLQEGDPIVIRTKNYWYVYKYTSKEIVTPDQVRVIAPNPQDPSARPTERLITLTTCEPKYSTPTHRWISYGKLSYWAKVSDGIPEELARTDKNGDIQFINEGKQQPTIRIKSLLPLIVGALVIYAVVFLAAAVVWRWPRRRAIHEMRERKPDLSLYGGLSRLQPGPTVIRVLLVLILLVAAGMALFEWIFPWAAANIPMLHQMSNYVSVSN